MVSSKMIVSLSTVAVATASVVTPVEKVIQLISNLESECRTEAEGEASTYDTFATFCKDKTTSLSKGITEGRDSIDLLSAEIAEKTANKAEKGTELSETKAEKERLTIELDKTTVRCEKEHAQYQVDDADNSKAIRSLENAKNSMQASKPAAAAAGLLAMRKVIERSPAFTEAMKVVDAGARWTSLMQVDPSDPEYKFHSNGIIDLLQKLLEEFTAKKKDTDDEWDKVNTACTDKKADLNEQIDTATTSISNLEVDIEKLATRIAEARGELVEADATLKDDKLYLTDLTKLCETRANEFDQRSKMRGDELGALQGALKILQEKVSGAEAANVRALLLQSKTRPVAFIQEGSSKASVQVQAHGLEKREVLQADQMQANALQMLGAEGKRLNSVMLIALAARAGADPFKKVKELIEKLIVRLVSEATAEATKKGFCDTEMGKATKSRDFRLAEVHVLSSEIGELDSKQDALELEIKELKETLEELKLTAQESTELRESEKKENVAQIKKAREGLTAVTEAIGILKTFYKSAAKASLLQASPVDEENPGAASGSYKGNQAASGGVIGLLEVIKSDFEHTVETVSAEEKQAAADFVEFDRKNKVATQGRTTKLELDTEDLAETKSTLEETHKDLKSNMDLLDSALEELEELKPTCVDSGMSYAERVEKREAEMEALKKAMCMLDADKIEPECK